jgi:hypothetical protein
MIEAMLFVFVVLTFLLALYSVRLARRLFVVGTNLEAVYSIMYAFRTHVEQIHEAEMFYGDQTLQALIDHSKELLDELDKYEDLMQIVGPEEQVEGDAEEE